MTDDIGGAGGGVAASEDRTGKVLSPEFVEGLDSAPTEEIRRRRDVARAEVDYQSYLRRLIQVRGDMLLDERKRRDTNQAPEALVDRLKSVLSEGPRGSGRGDAPRFFLPDADMAEAERRAEAAIPESILGRIESLPDEELARVLAAADRAERDVSDRRRGVIRAHDQLQEELKRRYREDPSQIPRGT